MIRTNPSQIMASSMLHSDFCSAIQIYSTFYRRRHQRLLLLPSRAPAIRFPMKSTAPVLRALSIDGNENGTSTSDNNKNKVSIKPPVCTADELHFVSLLNSNWRLALWRYIPPPQAPLRNRPLLLLSGVATNAVGYDLSPESSFARYMCEQGFDTWILEVRGAGLSMEQPNSKKIEQSAHKVSEEMEATIESAAQGVVFQEKDSDISNEVSISDRFFSTIEDFQKQLDLIVKYDWDFDCYLEEDVPAAMEYIRAHSQSKDGKLFAIGHSMGGILLYAMLSRFGSDGRDPKLAAVVTLASSLDYTSSSSSLKLLLPLADPAQALNVPGIPIGAMLSAAYLLTSRPPFVLSWLNDLISAQDMMHPELLRKLVLNNFCTVPSKVILQLTTAFREGGLCDRSGKFFYNDHLSKSNVPVLAVAGDKDLICPPKAVHETVKLIPEKLGSYKEFGEADGPHYAHYDLVGGRLAVEQVYPCIVEFLSRHD